MVGLKKIEITGNNSRKMMTTGSFPIGACYPLVVKMAMIPQLLLHSGICLLFKIKEIIFHGCYAVAG